MTFFSNSEAFSYWFYYFILYFYLGFICYYDIFLKSNSILLDFTILYYIFLWVQGEAPQFFPQNFVSIRFVYLLWLISVWTHVFPTPTWSGTAISIPRSSAVSFFPSYGCLCILIWGNAHPTLSHAADREKLTPSATWLS